MGNRLFQDARRFVDLAKNAGADEQQMVFQKAQNAISSAFANSTRAEQSQLSQMQEELDNLSLKG
jgi:polyhydroxyalkanoate synthesis regulator phasin